MSCFYEEGYYQGEITQQAMTKASTGTPQLVLRFRVLSFSDGSAVPRQYERTSYRAITEKTMQYVEKDLDALGFKGNSLRLLDPNTPGYISLVGTKAEFQCRHENDQHDEPREKWGVAWPAPGSNQGQAIEGAPVDAATYRQLDALFGRNRPTPQAQPQTVSRAVTAANPITDEDIPF